MAYTTREYLQKVIVTFDDLLDLQYAQLQAKNRFEDELTDNELETRLSSVIGILSIAFYWDTARSVRYAIASLLGSLTLNEKEMVVSTITNGYIGLGEAIEFMRNSNYDRIEIELPFREYRDFHTLEFEIRFIMGEGRVTRVHTGSGWIVL
ncbi:hypothetical protein [Bacillus litorisediminis]|uniref:hypothetical protein n=1 Tax=Bacillus litorisediminis TaxID=2922713 RepID=UPI001FABF2E5|nr:hypothetical protein [Bacillus litorisediminis]